MARSRIALPLLVAVLASCTPTAPLPPGPAGVREIAVPQPTNRTGGELLADNPGWIEAYLGAKRVTVPEQLAQDLRSELGRRGFTLVGPGAREAPTLNVELRRWEPLSSDYSQVTVDLVASLTEPGSDRALWTAERTQWRVPTPDARSVLQASTIASQSVAEALLDGWQPGDGSAATLRHGEE